jgi:hypothetical protein
LYVGPLLLSPMCATWPAHLIPLDMTILNVGVLKVFAQVNNNKMFLKIVFTQKWASVQPETKTRVQEKRGVKKSSASLASAFPLFSTEITLSFCFSVELLAKPRDDLENPASPKRKVTIYQPLAQRSATLNRSALVWMRMNLWGFGMFKYEA